MSRFLAARLATKLLYLLATIPTIAEHCTALPQLTPIPTIAIQCMAIIHMALCGTMHHTVLLPTVGNSCSSWHNLLLFGLQQCQWHTVQSNAWTSQSATQSIHLQQQQQQQPQSTYLAMAALLPATLP